MSKQDETGTDAMAENLNFPRACRLLTAGDYSGVFKKSQRYSDRYWTVLVRREVAGDARLGLAIAKKRAKRAVDRNRIKRVARESFRHHRHAMVGHELVAMNRDAAGTAEKAQLRRSIDTLMVKIIGVANKR